MKKMMMRKKHSSCRKKIQIEESSVQIENKWKPEKLSITESMGWH
jgi:hypothetical protein